MGIGTRNGVEVHNKYGLKTIVIVIVIIIAVCTNYYYYIDCQLFSDYTTKTLSLLRHCTNKWILEVPNCPETSKNLFAPEGPNLVIGAHWDGQLAVRSHHFLQLPMTGRILQEILR